MFLQRPSQKITENSFCSNKKYQDLLCIPEETGYVFCFLPKSTNKKQGNNTKETLKGKETLSPLDQKKTTNHHSEVVGEHLGDPDISILSDELLSHLRSLQFSSDQ